jgi:hypothetical protein
VHLDVAARQTGSQAFGKSGGTVDIRREGVGTNQNDKWLSCGQDLRFL